MEQKTLIALIGLPTATFIMKLPAWMRCAMQSSKHLIELLCRATIPLQRKIAQRLKGP
ncbi:hypothetical protein O0555_07630 [Brevibacillus laterosporus]|uniref:hypothetical protein n=1 Tax=Brevibacillus laterosporus TaxID=1465 RepID=UPI0018CF225D|nr:hypothetical protein [Brevibacillus laterosporus]MCR8937219.1 hypothetical protein [Brevibacillus laterosporus]MCZ0839857.1 hypothetical protein [Brevibacillus laterosporus]MCZ0845057.1 hypothetical protein [Brevibacillus laterosporus]MED1912026.1 hypothetical protein [Brevibacillus laterosporus]